MARVAQTEAGSTKYQIEIRGMKEILGKLDDNEVWQEPWQKGMEAIGVIGQNRAVEFAPMKRGTTIARMSHRVQKKPIPLYVVIKTTARSAKGYSYPRLHEYYRRSPHYGWMYKAMQASKGLWSGVMDTTARQIESKWGH